MGISCPVDPRQEERPDNILGSLPISNFLDSRTCCRVSSVLICLTSTPLVEDFGVNQIQTVWIGAIVEEIFLRASLKASDTLHADAPEEAQWASHCPWFSNFQRWKKNHYRAVTVLEIIMLQHHVSKSVSMDHPAQRLPVLPSYPG